MAAPTTEETVAAAEAPPVEVTQANPALRGMALALWGVVGTLLGYGILQTAIKASALFA